MSFDRTDLTLDDPYVELDLTDAALEGATLTALDAPLRRALAAMEAIEKGAVANVSEQRMVGHYWLRAPALAPESELADAIVDAQEAVRSFAGSVHDGIVAPPEAGAERFTKLVLCGIGGSSLGPMLLADALGTEDGLAFFAIDNTDPDGTARILAQVGDLSRALFVVISKSGGTPETRNAMLACEAACSAAGVDFAKRAVAVTGDGSALDQRAESEGWLARFPMWDWVGGRTSVCSAVGLLPAALMGVDTHALLVGAAAMDARTREPEPGANPAASLAAFWHAEGAGRGARDMVVLPYADRMLLLSRYLQQLVMESLGKRHDRQGREVFQGLAVYGNKGSTDQHAYVQQLRDGLHNFFAVFLRVLENGGGTVVEPESGVTSGDYLNGFFLGTRKALADSGRRSATLSVRAVDARTLGALIALFERAVGLYAELIDVNAYDQPGVEAGKKAAGDYLALQARVLATLTATPETADALSPRVDAAPRDVFEICRHLAASRSEVRMTADGAFCRS